MGSKRFDTLLCRLWGFFGGVCMCFNISMTQLARYCIGFEEKTLICSNGVLVLMICGFRMVELVYQCIGFKQQTSIRCNSARALITLPFPR